MVFSSESGSRFVYLKLCILSDPEASSAGLEFGCSYKLAGREGRKEDMEGGEGGREGKERREGREGKGCKMKSKLITNYR